MAERYSISSSNKEQKKSQAKEVKAHLFSNSTSLAFFISIVVSLFIIIGLVLLVFSYRSKITHLETDKKELQKQVDELKKQVSNTSSTLTSPATGITIPTSLKENVQNAVNTGSYSALQSNLASKVTVVKVGSGSSTMSSAEAIAALSYLSGATGSWNWDGSSSQYQSGSYGQYFGDNAIVGTSSDGYVISANVDQNGQIDAILVSSNTSDLT